MTTDERRWELDRLVKMGREPYGPPSPRQTVVAKTLDPWAWSDNAQEQIDYCSKHGLITSTTHFGAQYVVMRRLSLIKAAEVLRALDRQLAGLPELRRLDAQGVQKRLDAKAFDIYRKTVPRRAMSKAGYAASFMRSSNGLPAPKEKVGPEGEATLIWKERERTATLFIDLDGAMTMTLDPPVAAPMAMTFRGFDGTDDATLAAVTDWVHNDGPPPRANAMRSRITA